MIIHLLPEIEKAAWKKSSVDEPKRTKHKGSGGHHNNAKIPAETIIQMRKMYEIDRKTRRQVAQSFPEISENYVYKILDYICRANLRVKP